MSWFSDALSELDPTSGSNIFSDADDAAANVSIGYDTLTGSRDGGITDRTGDAIDQALTGLDDIVTDQDGKEAQDAAAAEAEALAQSGIDLQAGWMEYLKGVQQPYVEAGAGFLDQLTAFLDPAEQDAFRQEALDSDGFAAISQAAMDAQISNSAALGNRLSSGIQSEVLSEQGLLGQQYANSAVQDRLGQLTMGAGLGMNALSYTSPGISSSLGNIQSGYSQIGSINQANAANQGNGFSDWLGVANAGLGGYNAFSSSTPSV